jgi:hypothetical protein
VFNFLSEESNSGSDGDEDEGEEGANGNQSMVYKIVFFILLLILGAVGTLVLVENNNLSLGDSGGGGEGPSSPGLAPDAVSEEPFEPTFASQNGNENGFSYGNNDNDPGKKGPETEPVGLKGVGDDDSILDRIIGLINDFIEGSSL